MRSYNAALESYETGIRRVLERVPGIRLNARHSFEYTTIRVSIHLKEEIFQQVECVGWLMFYMGT